MRRAWILVAAFVAAGSTARAEPTGAEPKSTAAATLLTLAGAAIPTAVVVASAHAQDESTTDYTALLVAGSLGLAVLPGAGQWYARRAGVVGLGIRTVGAVGIIAGFRLLVTSDSGREDRNAILVFGGGALIAAGGIVFDVISSRSSVRHWNREHALQATLIRVPDGYGLGLAGAF